MALLLVHGGSNWGPNSMHEPETSVGRQSQRAIHDSPHNSAPAVVTSCYKVSRRNSLETRNLKFETVLCMAEKKARRKKSAAADPVIPDKLYFRIGEVARLCRLPAYVLRFWETEFPQLKPVKSNTGQRMYRQRDVENVLRIKKLLYQEGFTIAGARQQLKEEGKPAGQQSGLPFPKQSSRAHLKKVQQGLREILGILSSKRKAK